jgi:hypothetical protein
VNQTLAFVAPPPAPQLENTVLGTSLPDTGFGSDANGASDRWMLLIGIAGGALLLVAVAMRLRKHDER